MRRRFLVLALSTLALGTAVFLYRGPGWHWIRGHSGDSLAAAFLCFALGAILPTWPARRRWLVALCIACAVELLQLFHLPGRNTLLGEIVLGAHFDPLDFLWYAIGIAIAAGIETTMKTKTPHFALLFAFSSCASVTPAPQQAPPPPPSEAKAPPVKAPAPATKSASLVPALGKYSKEHSIWAVCEESQDGCNTNVQNTLIVRSYKGQSLEVEVDLVGANYHTCTLQQSMSRVSEGHYEWRAPKNEPECVATLKVQAHTMSLTSEGCREWCGARAHLMADFPRASLEQAPPKQEP